MRYKELFNLRGKTAVVVGGAGLIGKEIVAALAEFGSNVVIADSDRSAAAIFADKLARENLNVSPVYLNIAEEASVKKVIKQIDRKYDRIDILINCAYPRTMDWSKKLSKVPSVSWRKNIDMHLNGYFLCSREAAEHMKKAGKGTIINFASIYGMVGPDFSIYKHTEMTMPAAYSAIKGGIISFTRYMASYYGKYNIRINSISPGGVFDNQPSVFVKNYSLKTPLGRMAGKEEVAAAAVYLASDASAYVTGHNLVVDGGWSAI